MAKHLHGGPLEGGESAWVPSQRACELDDCQQTIESRKAPILLRTDGLILMRQNQGRYSLLRLYIHSQTSLPRHLDYKALPLIEWVGYCMRHERQRSIPTHSGDSGAMGRHCGGAFHGCR